MRGGGRPLVRDTSRDTCRASRRRRAPRLSVTPCCAAPPRCPRSSAAAGGARARARLVAGVAEAAQQLDLDRVHRVDVGVAQLDRALHDRVAVEQLVAPRRSRAPPRPCARAPRRSRPRAGRGRRRRHELEVAARDLEARLRERHLEVVDERAEERPARGRAAAAPRGRLAVGAAPSAVPQPYQAGSSAAVLRPGEDPRDRAQRAEVVARSSGRRAGPRADRRAARARRRA